VGSYNYNFLGENIDAIDVAERIGINKDRPANFHEDTAGTSLNYQVMSETVSKRSIGHS